MYINENYGNIEMPSEIQDSFEHSELKESKLLYEEQKRNFDDSINLDSSIEDTFLENFNQINHNEQRKVQEGKEEPSLSISKGQIKVNLLPGQKHTERIQIVNPTAYPILVKWESIFELSSHINENLKEIQLDPWERTQLKIKIEQKQNEFGDIFETIIGEYCFHERKRTSSLSKKKNKIYMKIKVHFITPKLKLKYSGCSDVINVKGNKVSMNRIAKNKYGEYCLEISLSGMERFECEIQAYGDLSVVPKGLTLYNDEMRKLTIQKRQKKNGVVVVKVINAKVIFALGVEFI